MNPLAELNGLGQSIWYDYIRRDLMRSGELARLIEEDRLCGMTSNPAIFSAAIGKGDLYDEVIRGAARDATPLEVYERIAIADIQSSADQFRPTYDATGGKDGMVSLEVSPSLAHDTEATINEARRLRKACDRDNVMIKIPGTKEGLPAVETCLYEGIHINVTLLFSVERYREVMETWFRALERRVTEGKPVDQIASVASFFVSRVDSKVDAAITGKLEGAGGDAADRLGRIKSRLGIANARLAYQAFLETIRGSERFARLAEHGAQVQRPLWASTSTKDPELPETLYVDGLIGPDTVNTVPPVTYVAYRRDGKPEVRIGDDLDEANEALKTLDEFGIDFAAVTRELETEGVQKFVDAFDSLLKTIETKRAEIHAR